MCQCRNCYHAVKRKSVSSLYNRLQNRVHWSHPNVFIERDGLCSSTIHDCNDQCFTAWGKATFNTEACCSHSLRCWRKLDLTLTSWRTTDQYPTWPLYQNWWKKWFHHDLSATSTCMVWCHDCSQPIDALIVLTTETALLKILSDVHTAVDSEQVTLLALLDLSAAFVCVDHDILLRQLCHKFGLFGICGAALEWMTSFLHGRSQQVYYKGHLSVKLFVLFGVPQGSVLGPLLFLLYVAELFDVITECGFTGHAYADDSQVYVSVPDGSTDVLHHKHLRLDGQKSPEAEWREDTDNLARYTTTTWQDHCAIIDIAERQCSIFNGGQRPWCSNWQSANLLSWDTKTETWRLKRYVLK